MKGLDAWEDNNPTNYARKKKGAVRQTLERFSLFYVVNYFLKAI